MAKFKEKQVALELRAQGKSYSQIKSILNLSKSTLSYWLRDYPLSPERIRELRDWNEQRIERQRETMRKKKETRLKEVYVEQSSLIFPINLRELFLAGLFLYWGEGAKRGEGTLSVSNTDPSLIKFFIRWLTDCFGVPKTKLKAMVHLYNDMEIDKELEYWSKIIDIPRTQFTKPYIKETSLSAINHKGSFGHGTCNVRIGDARLSEKILMGIKAVSDYCLGQ